VIYNVSDSTFQSEMKSEGLTLVNFWAPWCGACRSFAPILEEFDTEGTEDVKILKINIEEDGEVANRFQVMSLPTTILFKNSIATDQEIGTLSIEDLRSFISRNRL